VLGLGSGSNEFSGRTIASPARADSSSFGMPILVVGGGDVDAAWFESLSGAMIRA